MTARPSTLASDGLDASTASVRREVAENMCAMLPLMCANTAPPKGTAPAAAGADRGKGEQNLVVPV